MTVLQELVDVAVGLIEKLRAHVAVIVVPGPSPVDGSTGEPGGLFGHVAVGQDQWYHFGVGAPPILVYFKWGLGCSLGGTGF